MAWSSIMTLNCTGIAGYRQGHSADPRPGFTCARYGADALDGLKSML